MVLLDNLFSKKPGGKQMSADDADAPALSAEDEAAQDRKSQRMERRELLYAVVRECMARVGVLSSSYKYKVLSLDSRGSLYLIMMDLPRDMAAHVDQLAEIEALVTQTAKTRHQIEVSAVYWRINELAKTTVLRKPRPEAELTANRPAVAPLLDDSPVIDGSRMRPAAPGRQRFEPLRPDEMKTYKQAPAGSPKARPAAPAPRAKPADFAPTEMRPGGFEPTRLADDEAERLPLSRTQFGDLI